MDLKGWKKKERIS